MKSQLKPVKVSHALLLLCLLQCLVWSLGVVDESSQQYYLLQNEFLCKGHLNLVSAEELLNHFFQFQRLVSLALNEQQHSEAAQLSLLQQLSLERHSDSVDKFLGCRPRFQPDLLFKSLENLGGADSDSDAANLLF